MPWDVPPPNFCRINNQVVVNVNALMRFSQQYSKPDKTNYVVFHFLDDYDEEPNKTCVPVWFDHQDCYETKYVLADAWAHLLELGEIKYDGRNVSH